MITINLAISRVPGSYPTTRTTRRFPGHIRTECTDITTAQTLFDVYYVARSDALDRATYQHCKGKLSNTAEYSRRTSRIETWFKYKIETLGQQLVVAKLKQAA